MGKKISKASKRRLLIFGSASAFIILYFLFSLTTMTHNIKVLNKKQAQLENSLLELKEDEKNLRNTLEKLNDPDYIARYARETYSYSKDGEYIIKIDDNKKEEGKEENIKNYTKPVLIISSIILILIILYIIRKSRKS